MAFDLQLEWAGRVWNIPNSVEAELVEDIELFGDVVPSARSFPVTIQLGDISIAEEISRGRSLETARAKLLYDGEVLVSGHLRQPQWRYDDEPIRASIEERSWGRVDWPSEVSYLEAFPREPDHERQRALEPVAEPDGHAEAQDSLDPFPVEEPFEVELLVQVNQPDARDHLHARGYLRRLKASRPLARACLLSLLDRL